NLRTTEPEADWWQERGVPREIAVPATRVGRPVGDTAANLTMVPWAKHTGEQLGEAAARDPCMQTLPNPVASTPAEAQTTRRPSQPRRLEEQRQQGEHKLKEEEQRLRLEGEAARKRKQDELAAKLEEDKQLTLSGEQKTWR